MAIRCHQTERYTNCAPLKNAWTICAAIIDKFNSVEQAEKQWQDIPQTTFGLDVISPVRSLPLLPLISCPTLH